MSDVRCAMREVESRVARESVVNIDIVLPTDFCAVCSSTVAVATSDGDVVNRRPWSRKQKSGSIYCHSVTKSRNINGILVETEARRSIR